MIQALDKFSKKKSKFEVNLKPLVTTRPRKTISILGGRFHTLSEMEHTLKQHETFQLI